MLAFSQTGARSLQVTEGTGTFGLRLKELRERAGLTQPELAEKSGVARASVANLEQGRYEPSWPTVQALAEALNVTPDAFQEPPAATTQPRGRGRPPKQDIPTAAPQRRTGRKMAGKPKREPENL
jgi:transcriptional regulator with XRE-family HTH domain